MTQEKKIQNEQKQKEQQKQKKDSPWKGLKMFFQRVYINIDASVRQMFRSPSTIFFTFLYPLIFILVLGAIFNGSDDPVSFTLYVQSHDQGVGSELTPYRFWNDTMRPVVEDLNNSAGDPLVVIKDVPLVDGSGDNVSAGIYLEEQEGYACLVIPKHFTEYVISNTSINATLIMVKDNQLAQAVNQIVSGIFYGFNLGLTGGVEKASMDSSMIFVGEGISYAEYLIPGMIAIAFMNNALTNSISRYVEFRELGMFKKFISSPMRRVDFISSEMILQYLLAIASVLLAVLTGWIVFKLSWSMLHWMLLPIMLAGVMIFTGIGMICSRLAKTGNAAGALSNMIAFQMMFLSGAMFDVSNIPVIKTISKLLPLTYVVDALRAAMVTRNMPTAWLNLGISLGLGTITMIAGILLTKWKDE
ncbi:MAG: ABC transporter permease [Promethearchaeota archaeon]|nr:MAG: ABC transporter permease [Candidatus Lokiarchaeota archaeon]